MALLKSITLPTGIDVEKSYIRISFLIGDKDKLSFNADYYLSKGAYEIGKDKLEQRQYEFTPSVKNDAENFIKQGYDYLKTLPEFEGSIDVLEDGQ